jgi:ribose transport system substrate-binding protein
MSTRRTTLPKAGTAAFAAMLMAACSPGTTSDNGSSSSSSSGANSALAEVQADLDTAMKARDSFAVPGDAVDPSALKGKTVYYIPLTAQNSVFQLYGKKIGEALDSVGVDLQVCDGGANPSQIGGCLDQAMSAKAAAIVTDSIPYGMAGNAIDAARQAGIPVIIANQVADAQHPADKTLAYVNAPTSKMVASVADWMIVDSGGKASVVLQKVTDNPSTVAWGKAGEKEFADRCPDCTVVVNEISASNFPLIPSSTSSALLSNPDTDYVLSEFEVFVQPTLGGIQQSPNAAKIQVGSAAASLDGLKMVAGGNLLHADVAQNFRYQGWATADAVFRMVAAQKVPEYDVSYRLFTAKNIGDIKVTADAEASGEWFGPTDYTKKFAALWGQN